MKDMRRMNKNASVELAFDRVRCKSLLIVAQRTTTTKMNLQFGESNERPKLKNPELRFLDFIIVLMITTAFGLLLLYIGIHWDQCNLKKLEPLSSQNLSLGIKY
ncbi:Hypothetical protein CINCED_3A018473 [Cinara cedri]|uniref:Uncharacterized protein n=1 Tax=Cinara cedri TaxID=506608 RepID=A0A5E4NKZ1_9HEMI|nr:Hypothetical protein CINCED_3A018473 [Cinara cedri]